MVYITLTFPQSLNVFKMKMMGATVVPVNSGAKTLKDAINEAMRGLSYLIAIHSLIHHGRLGNEYPYYTLPHRVGHRAASVPNHCAGFPKRNRYAGNQLKYMRSHTYCQAEKPVHRC